MSTRPPRRPPGIHVSPGFKQFALDQLQDVPEFFARPMFGGVGLYSGDIFFGILANDKLYLKVDDRTRTRFKAAGMRPFKPYPGRSTTFMYYEVPLGVLESAAELTEWAKAAIAAAGSTGERRVRRARRARPTQRSPRRREK